MQIKQLNHYFIAISGDFLAWDISPDHLANLVNRPYNVGWGLLNAAENEQC